MCGIAGAVGAPVGTDLGAVGRDMIGRIRHRGPDALATAILPQDRGVFGHARLKIIDLSERGAQPYWDRGHQVVLVFNGEIYNYRELRRGLQHQGVVFRSESDTEVILEQYLRYGEVGLDALDGMFAFALWDAREERLVLARDRLGKKPLYWAETKDGALVFGSEVKALAAYPGLELRADRQKLPEYLSYGYVETPGSFYQGIHRLPPATRLVRRAGQSPVLSRYWSLDAIRPRAIGVEEAQARVRLAVGRAVEKRLVADVPLGAFLSGGVDSSIIVAEMAARSSEPVRTFCIGFDDDQTFDERRYAKLVAERFGTQHTELVVSSSPAGLLEKLLHHHDEPYGDSSAIAAFAVAEATRRHVTVALTGDGGDEVFAGYTRFRGGLLTGLLPPLLGGALHQALAHLPEPRGYKNPLALLRRFVAHGDRSGDEQLLAWNTFFVGQALKELLPPGNFGADFDPWSVLGRQAELLGRLEDEGRDRLDCILRHNLDTYLLDDLLVKTDRTTMAVALEARCPFLDTELLELAFSLPGTLKMRFGQLKWLLRESYRQVLPAAILDRKKHGFGVPLAKWWSGPLRGMMQDLLRSPSARIRDELVGATIDRVLDEHLEGSRDHGQRIFLLLNLELWLRALARAG